MFKFLNKIAIIGLLLATQCDSANAGVPTNYDLKPAFVMIGLASAGAGALGSFGLYKAFQWTRHEQGPKKYVGFGVLTCTGLAAAYGFGKMSNMKFK